MDLIKAKEILRKPILKRNAEELNNLFEMTKEIPFFKSLADETISECCKFAYLREFSEGEAVFYQGDWGSEFFVILEGIVGIFIRIDSKNKAGNFSTDEKEIPSSIKRESGNSKIMKVKELGSGASFGELALLEANNVSRRAASIISLNQTSFFVLERKDFQKILSAFSIIQ